MRFRVLEGHALEYRGKVYAEGVVVEIPVDSKDPAERKQAQLDLRGQHAKIGPAPTVVSAPVDRSVESAPVVREVSRKKVSRKPKE